MTSTTSKMKMLDAVRIIEQHRDGAIVLPVMQGNRAWREVTRNPELDFPQLGSMGKSSSIGLGLALAMPERRIIIIDGDGSLLNNLGSLVTIAGKAPKRFYHCVMVNGAYAVTGGQPIPNAGRFSFAGLAREAGYRAAYEFSDLEDFASAAPRVFREEGPVMVHLNVELEINTVPITVRQQSIPRDVDRVNNLLKTLGTRSPRPQPY